MAITVDNIVDLVNDHIDDTTTDRVSNAQRFRKITEATNWVQLELKNDHQVKSVEFDYYDTVHEYKIKSTTAELLDTNQLNLPLGEDYPQFTKRSERDLKRELSDGTTMSGYAIEWKDGEATLLVNYNPNIKALLLGSMESTTADGGEWTSDSDNLRVDEIEYTQGYGSLAFDYVAGTASGVTNETISEKDLSDYNGTGTWLFDVFIPDVTDLTSVTLVWGSTLTTTGAYSMTVTKDLFGDSFVSGKWMTLAVDWDSSELTTTGTPDDESINYLGVWLLGSSDIANVRVDNIRLVVPQELELKYLSYVVGTDSAGDDLVSFTATTDIPYFSGQYDNLKFAVAHYASSLLFKDLRLYDDQINHENSAHEAIKQISHLIPQSRSSEIKSFRPTGLNFSSRSRSGRRF